MGPGTTFIAPNSPLASPLIPSVKKRVLGLPLDPPVPNPRAQRPPGVIRSRRYVEGAEIAPELTGHGLPLVKCEAYNRVYDQPYGSS
jgi:hypothetical protein